MHANRRTGAAPPCPLVLVEGGWAYPRGGIRVCSYSAARGCEASPWSDTLFRWDESGAAGMCTSVTTTCHPMTGRGPPGLCQPQGDPHALPPPTIVEAG